MGRDGVTKSCLRTPTQDLNLTGVEDFVPRGLDRCQMVCRSSEDIDGVWPNLNTPKQHSAATENIVNFLPKDVVFALDRYTSKKFLNPFFQICKRNFNG